MIWQDFTGRAAGSGFQERGDGGFQSEIFILAKLGYIGLQRMNIRAVAKRARVSTATVSRTINGSDKVSPKTAARVLRAVEDLNFYPDTNARALGTGRSRLYGLIISDITNPFFPELVKAFEDIAVEHGQEVMIANTNYEPARMESCVTRMLQRKVDGVAIMTSEMDDRLIEVFSRRHVPLVFMDAGVPGTGVSSVRIDYHAGVAQAMDHLIELGHKRIAFISGPLRLASARTRFHAFTEVLERSRLKGNPDMIQEGNHRVDGGHAAMQRILSSGAKPTAILASNDLTAIGAMGAIYEYGLRVPEDISVIGFDDILLSAFTRPALTTLRLPRGEIATAAFRALFQSREAGATKPGPGAEYLIQPELVVRKSTGPAPR
jgi:DNA-binding LacI/PurR family transcriptional regulator